MNMLVSVSSQIYQSLFHMFYIKMPKNLPKNALNHYQIKINLLITIFPYDHTFYYLKLCFPGNDIFSFFLQGFHKFSTNVIIFISNVKTNSW